MMAKRTTIQTGISIPSELKKEMDRVDLNWSAVAADAFRAKLLEIQSRAKGETMDAVIARLKAAAELEDDEDHKEGLKCGQEWAKNEATPKQLRRLHKTLSHQDFAQIFHSWIRDGAIGVSLQEVIDTAPKDFQEKHSDFWEVILGENWESIEEPDFARGFIDGAMEVWEAVSDKL